MSSSRAIDGEEEGRLHVPGGIVQTHHVTPAAAAMIGYHEKAAPEGHETFVRPHSAGIQVGHRPAAGGEPVAGHTMYLESSVKPTERHTVPVHMRGQGAYQLGGEKTLSAATDGPAFVYRPPSAKPPREDAQEAAGDELAELAGAKKRK